MQLCMLHTLSCYYLFSHRQVCMSVGIALTQLSLLSAQRDSTCLWRKEKYCVNTLHVVVYHSDTSTVKKTLLDKFVPMTLCLLKCKAREAAVQISGEVGDVA